MRIAFVVNNLESIDPLYTTIRFAMEAINRGHFVWIVPANGFSLDEGDRVLASGVEATQKRYRSTKTRVFLSDLKKSFKKLDDITISDFDVLFLRGNPFQQKSERKWLNDVGMFFGRLAMRSGVIVVNDPDGLGKAVNESYLDLFPKIVRNKLIKDGIFFAGFKIAGNKIMEINVFCSSGLDMAEQFEKLNSSIEVIAALERKVETLKFYGHDFRNSEVAAGF